MIALLDTYWKDFVIGTIRKQDKSNEHVKAALNYR